MSERVPIKLPPVFETVVLMEPVGKGRPRVVRHGDNVITYTPDKTAAADLMIRAAVNKTRIFFPAGTPLSMELIFYMSKPKSVKRRYPTVGSDVDNQAKLVMDALQRYVYPNDSQVVDLKASKRYISEGEPPRIYIRVRETGG